MWSNQYDYYRIRASANYCQIGDTKHAQAMLDAMPELERVGLMNYQNALGYPWIELVLANGQAGNFNCSNDTWYNGFNMISIVCSKSENGSIPNAQMIFLIRVAQTFNWELISEENDASQENVLLWKPI